MRITHIHTQRSQKRKHKQSILNTAVPDALRLQSAMEYLMTYGWAILIIAVVLGALFQLGVFNSATFAPKAPPGACQVFRPNGPGSTSFINLEGVCNGELPQYVASIDNSRVYGNITNNPDWSHGFTLTVWVRLSQQSDGYPFFIGVTSGNTLQYEQAAPFFIIFSDSGDVVYANYKNGVSYGQTGPSPQLNIGNWYFLAGTYDPALTSNNLILYLNGNAVSTVSLITTFAAPSPPTVVLPTPYGSYGNYSNGQIYNTSLSQPEINALYLEGIGGAPIDLQNLVGWWPLNGNWNDYSGNLNNLNGMCCQEGFTSGWESGYTTP